MILRVSSPCPKSWRELRGNNRVRYCDECRLNVYNVADLSHAEIKELIRRSSGRVCVRLFLRGDRTATTRDCPKDRHRELLRKTFLTASVLALVVFTALFRGMARPDTSKLPGWVRGVADSIDPPPKDQPPQAMTVIRVVSRWEIVGKLVEPPAPPTQSPPPAATP
jgi:hypothetical protein